VSVPLILAIEPERQQAALLSGLVRGRLRAELVLADTTEQALVAIGDRVPDLVLIPALLSAQEDAALAGALRMIAAAANVQMLTIPLLAAPAPVPERFGVLAKWRRSKRAVPTAAGCDPAVFAEQIASYLADNGEPTTSDAVVEADAPAPAGLATPVDSTAETSAVDARGPSEWPRSFALIDWQGVPSASAPLVMPATNDVVVGDVEGLAVSDAVVAEVEGLALSHAVVAEVEGPALSDVMLAGVEGAAGAETGLVAELIGEPMRHAVAPLLDAVAVEAPSPEALVVADAEHLTLAPPSETVLVADEPSFQEPAIELFAAPPVEQLAEVGVETRTYDVSVGESAGDAALMASIDAILAASRQSSVVSDQSSAIREPSPVVSRRETAVGRESTVDMPVLVPQENVDAFAANMADEAWPAIEPVVDVRAVEAVAPLECISTPDAGPDPLLFCDVETGPPAIDVRDPQPPPAAVVAAVAARTPAKPERPEWVELIESLRQDIERLKMERLAPVSIAVPREEGPVAILAPDAGSPMRVVSGVHTPKRPTVPAKKAPRPVQDEWGLFDPEQCGFASLLAKLSEVTEGNDRGGSSRVLDH
jgi:hypothetical protein